VSSALEEELAQKLKLAKIKFEREYKAIEGRRFKWDFFIDPPGNLMTKKPAILVEVQGGLWMKKGGHTSGVGVSRDCEKNNLAVLAGYRPLLVTGDHIKSGQALEWIKEALK